MHKKLSSKGKKFPKFKSDEEMARFVEKNDISDYINSKNFVPAHEVFEFAPEFESKDATITMRFPLRLLDRVKTLATKKHIPYQRLIRVMVEAGLSKTPV